MGPIWSHVVKIIAGHSTRLFHSFSVYVKEASPFKEIASVSCLKMLCPSWNSVRVSVTRLCWQKIGRRHRFGGEKKHWEKFTCIFISMFISMWCCAGENKIKKYRIDCVEVLSQNISDSLNKCQYPYILKLFSPGFEKLYLTSVKGEKKQTLIHSMECVNLKNMQWQN